MINNRQNGRRRGRGGPQVRNGQGNGPERGNRIDNRARGNAAQLHEKYRNLARDMQTQGDRVMTEYYLQFTDHYFRVLSEGRARFEEQNPNQQQRRPQFQNDDFDEGFEGEAGDESGEAEGQPRRFDREPRREAAYEDGETQPRERDYRDTSRSDGRNEGRNDNRDARDNRDGRDAQRGNREVRADRPDRDDQRPRRDNRDQRPQRDYAPRDAAPAYQPEPAEAAAPSFAPPAEAAAVIEAEAPRPRRGRPPRRVEAANGDAGPAQIEIDRLPPAFAPADAVDAAPAPRGRRKSVAAVEAPVAEAAGEEGAPRRRRVRRDATDDGHVAA